MSVPVLRSNESTKATDNIGNCNDENKETYRTDYADIGMKYDE